MRGSLETVTAPLTATLRQVIEVIDRSAMMVALLVQDDGVLVGLLTDGDVRRAILKGAGLEDPALPFATTAPQTVTARPSRALVLDVMRASRISAVPEVDGAGRLVGLHTLSDIVGVQPLSNPAVIMAGGRGTRLGELTRSVPKPLMEVAGRSILEWIVLTLIGGGVREVYVSVNHFADQIEEHLGDGGRLGCTVHYLREEVDNPLGTAGSLAMLKPLRPDLDVPVLVMNGDLMVQFEPESLIRFHEASGSSVTVATRPYQHTIPFGVVEATSNGHVQSVREKPTLTVDVNAGLYAVSPDALAQLSYGEFATMPGLIEKLLDQGEPVSAWQLPSADWIDIGTPAELARAKGHI